MVRPRWTGIAASVVGTTVGVWLMIAPVAFAYVGTPAEMSHRIAGPVLAFLWIVSAWDITRSVRWWTIPPGLWLLAEPLVLDEPVPASVIAVMGGALSIAAAFLAHNGDVARKYGGGWKGLWLRRPRGEAPSGGAARD